MSVNDPVGDMLTRIRNALMARRDCVDVPYSNLKKGVAEVLKREGYIRNFQVVKGDVQGTLHLHLKYGPDGEQVVRGLKRVSTPGKRVYRKWHEIERVLGGLGTAVVSTPKGVMSDKDCRKEKVGGELLCFVW